MTNQELIALIKKNPIGVACGVLALAVGGALYYRSGDIPAAEAELAEKAALAEKYALNIKFSTQLPEQHEALVAANKAISERLIRASQLGTNTQFFYKLESDTGVKLIDFRQSTPTSAKPAKGAFMPVAFSVAVQGSIAQVLDFLRQIESGTHYGRVLTANCSVSPTARSAPLTLSLTLELLGQP